MDLGIHRQDLCSKIQKQAGNRWRGGERTVDLDNEIKAIVQTKSVGERLKTLFNTKEPRVYETVIITDAKGQKIDGCNFTLSKFGMRARTKELESKLDEVLKNINSNEASSNPLPVPSTPSPAPQNLTPTPDNLGTPQASTEPPTHTQDVSAPATPANNGIDPEAPNPSSVSKTSTESSRPQSGGSVIPQPPPNTSIPIPTDATSAASGTTVTPEATISPELQTILNKPAAELTKEDATKLATAYGDPNVPDKQKLGEKLSELLDTLKGKLSDAATNLQEVKNIADDVNNIFKKSLSKLNNSAPEELKNLQKNASELSSKANRFNNANTFIDDINKGKQEQFTVTHKSILQQAAMDTNFPRHEEALQALMSVVSQSCEKIQKEGFLSEAIHVTSSLNPVFQLKYANDALKEIFAKNSSNQFTQLQEAIGNMISKACQEFCGVIDSPSKDEEKFSPQDINNLCTLKDTLPANAAMPEPMQNALNKATTELCGRIQGNLKPDTDDVAMLKSIHNALNDDSAECQAIEKTFFENLEAITNAYEKYPSGHKDPTAIKAIAQKHANRLSAKEVTELVNEYRTAVADHGAQAENLKAQLKLTLGTINIKIEKDFEHITPEDTQKLQTILQTLSPKDINVYRKSTYQMMDAQLKALQVLQNANSNADDFASAFNKLENAANGYGNITDNPLHKALKAKLPVDTSASVPIQNLSQEALQQLDEETFKNLPDDAEKLTSDALQDLLDQTSIEDMTRYAEVYAAGFNTRGTGNNGLIHDQLNAIAQAVGQKLLKGADQISNDDVQKLQVLIDKSRAYKLNIDQSIQTETEAQLHVIQTLQDVQRNTANSAIDNAFTLIDAYRQYPVDDIFRQAIDQASASNVESACKIFVGNLDQFTGNARKLIDLYDKLPNNSPARGVIRKTFADHHQEIQDKLASRSTISGDTFRILKQLQEIANQTT